MSYKYKIQWVFQEKKRALKMIDILGARSLDLLNFRDENFKIIYNYSGFVRHPCGMAELETKKYINKVLKKNGNIHYIEFLRK